jgi:hypothetical protein
LRRVKQRLAMALAVCAAREEQRGWKQTHRRRNVCRRGKQKQRRVEGFEEQEAVAWPCKPQRAARECLRVIVSRRDAAIAQPAPLCVAGGTAQGIEVCRVCAR